MPPLRILHAVFSSQTAGSERYCIDLANGQAEHGHEVHVAGHLGSAMARELSDEVIFHGGGAPLWRAGPLQRLALSLGRRRFLRRTVAQLAPDVCHGHLSSACRTLGVLPTRARSVATLHVGYKPREHARLAGLICVNSTQANSLDGFAGRVRVIPNWLPRRSSPLSSVDLRAELGISRDNFVIGSIGRLHQNKGLDVLVRAFRSVAPAHATLVIAGEGPMRAELEALAGGDPRIHLLGYRDDTASCLAALDLYVAPSREESFGLAILEAMAAGLPVIATDVEGPGEYLRPLPATLIAPDSVEALERALAIACVADAKDRSPVRYDLSRFNREQRISEVTSFYAELPALRQTVPHLTLPNPIAA
jgi:glycosyltransferase involved in cell wall biosynthesis